MTILSVSVAAATVLGACMSSAAAQGTVVGAAMPGTMADTFTIPFTEFDADAPSGCGTKFVGCTGDLFECAECVPHEVAGSITVIDDCTFRIQGWQFDGVGPAVEWWGAKQDGVDKSFPYPANAMKIGELGAPGTYQLGSLHGGDSDVVVRLGLDADGTQIEFSDDINHISVWCEDFAVDFGNTPLTCGAGASGAAKAPGVEAAAEGAPAEPEATAATPAEPEATAATPAAPADDDTADTTPATPESSAARPMHAAVGAAATVGALGLALL